MRIGINTLFYVPGDVGGTETYLRNTLLEIAEAYPDDNLVVFTTRDNNDVLCRDLRSYSHVEFVPLAFRSANRPLRIVLEQVLLPFAVARARVDVLWSPGYTAPALSPCPQVVTVHDLQYKSHPIDMTFIERIVLDILVRIACRKCKAVITVSEFSKQEVVKYNFASADKVKAVHLGVNKAFAEKVEMNELSESYVSRFPKSPYILCVAHTYPHKNVHLLVDAFVRIQDKVPHNLVIVGKSRRGEYLIFKSLQHVKHPERVNRFEELNFTELRHLFQHAELFVLPSAYEGFGLPVLEAMMSGTLVVAGKKASVPEVGGECILYCDPLEDKKIAESILRALSLSSEQKMPMLANAQSRAALFTWQVTGHRTMNVLKKTVLNV